VPDAEFHWIAVDNADNLDVECSFDKLKNVIRCVETDKFYKSINSAHRLTGVSIQSLTSVVNGRAKTANNYHWERIPYTDNLVIERDIPKPPGSTKVKVKCVETGKVYNTITEAAKALGIDSSNISGVLYGVRITAGGYHWKRV
jgi:hypothetical protein